MPCICDVSTSVVMQLSFLGADKDECASSSTACGPNTKCTNAPGSYSCACETGYELLAGKDAKTDGCTGELWPGA